MAKTDITFMVCERNTHYIVGTQLYHQCVQFMRKYKFSGVILIFIQ